MGQFTSSAMKVTNSARTTLKQLTLTAMYLAVIVVLESLMAGLPNVQLTVVLMMAFAVTFPKAIFMPFVLAYVVIDNFAGIFLMGSIDPFIMIPMTVAWLVLVYATYAFRKKPFYWLIGFGLIYGFLYGWIYIPAHMIRFGITTFWPYLLADLPFEITMAVTNVISISLLYPPLVKLMRDLMSGIKDSEATR
jgi:energy-coupling factor transport system substrate-specific component